MNPDTVIDAVSAVFMVTGALMSLAAAIGLLRFPDLMSRMHAATKPQQPDGGGEGHQGTGHHEHAGDGVDHCVRIHGRPPACRPRTGPR